MEKTKLVTIITICKNADVWIEKTILSVLNQTNKNYEYIVVDGGSTDRTLEIINRYRSKIDILISEPDTGIFNAQNKGAKLSKGEYIFFLNAGDIFFNEKVLSKFEMEQKGEDLIYFNVLNNWGHSSKNWNRNGYIPKIFPEKINKLFWFRDYLSHQVVFARKDLFSEIGYFDESLRFTADHDFFYKVWNKEKLTKKHIDSFSTIFDMTGVSSSPEFRERVLREFKKIKLKNFGVLNYLLYSGLSNDTRNFLSPTLHRLAYIKNILFSKALKKIKQTLKYLKIHFLYRKKIRSLKNSNLNAAVFKNNGKLKILVINTYDKAGGAARATWRIVNSLANSDKIEILYLVKRKEKLTNDERIILAKRKKNLIRIKVKFRDLLQKIFLKRKFNVELIKNYIPHSIADSSGYDVITQIRELNPDVVHLNWVQDGLLTVEEIGKIEKPIVWTIHDMWPFCGAEHYNLDERYKFGYAKKGSGLLDLNSHVWNRKFESWKLRDKFLMVGVSEWISNEAKASILFKYSTVKTIHNCLDLNIFKPHDKKAIRVELNLPKEAKIILMGAESIQIDARKGFSDMLFLMNSDKLRREDIVFVSFGSNERKTEVVNERLVYNLGKIVNDEFLSKIYSAADLMIVPSRMETFGQTASEAIACGTPVLCYNCTGLTDIVDHNVNGYLVEPFNQDALVNSVNFLFEDPERLNLMSINARRKAEEKFSYQRVSSEYVRVYEAAFKQNI